MSGEIDGRPGMTPGKRGKSGAIAARDPRLSLEERYGTHDGYVAVVRKAAEQAVKDRFLLPDDAARLVQAAEASAVLAPAHASLYVDAPSALAGNRSRKCLSSSRSTGLTKCAANPADCERDLSASCPYPVTAMSSAGTPPRRNRSATS